MATDLNKTLNLEDAINNLDIIIKKIEVLNESLISFSKSTEDTAKSIDELNKAQKQSEDIIEDTTKATSELDKIKQQNLKATEQLQNVYKEENEELIRNKIAVQEANKEIRDKVKAERDSYKTTQEVNKALTTNAKTIKEAQQQNKALRAAVKELDTTTEEGQKQIEEYNKIIDENSKLIKDNSDAYVQQKIQIGDYTIALDDLKGGFKNVGVQIKAFLANPVVLTVTAIVGAFSALYDALGKTEEGQKLLTMASGLFQGVLTALSEVVVSLTKPLIALFTDPQQAIEDLKTSIKNKIFKVFEELTNLAVGVGKILKGVFTLDSNMISEGAKDAKDAFIELNKEVNPTVIIMNKIAETSKGIVDTAKEQARINKERFELEQSRNKLIVDEARLSRDIAEARRVANDADVSSREQLEAIQKAEELTRELTQRRLADKKEELRLLVEEQKLGSNNLEDNKEYAQLQAEIIKLEEQEANQLRTISKRRETILNSIEKEGEELEKIQNFKEEAFEINQELRGIEIEQETEDQRRRREEAERLAELQRTQREEKIAAEKQAAENSIDIAGDLFGLEKEAAIAKAGINISEGITKALASKGILGVAEGVLISAAGAVQIAKIAGTNAYYKGTEHAKKGLAWVSERGAEIIEDKNGMRLIPDMSLINLEGGEKIHTAEETKQILFDDTRIVRELKRQKTNVIVNINESTFNSKYRMKA